ncbi:MAG: hypothetical protein AABX39_05280 [Nanoarchaeota archaeon]|mgnify:CR=1 FL=1
MAYIRKKKVKGYTYYYIVEGDFVKQKLKQKTIRYLGNVKNILEKFDFWDKNH